MNSFTLNHFIQACETAELFSKPEAYYYNNKSPMRQRILDKKFFAEHGYEVISDSPYDVLCYKHPKVDDSCDIFIGQTNLEQVFDIATNIRLMFQGSTPDIDNLAKDIANYARSQHDFKYINIHGFSLGGTLALEIAARVNDVSAFAIAPYRSAKEPCHRNANTHALIDYRDISYNTDLIGGACTHYEAHKLYKITHGTITKLDFIDSFLQNSFLKILFRQQPILSIHNPKYYLKILHNAKKYTWRK